MIPIQLLNSPSLWYTINTIFAHEISFTVNRLKSFSNRKMYIDIRSLEILQFINPDAMKENWPQMNFLYAKLYYTRTTE